MSYFNILKKHKVTVPPFWTDQSYFLRDGFLMGFTLEFIFLYFNAYDSFTRKATIKCLERVRYSEYKLKEKAKLDLIKDEKRRKLQMLQELKDRREAGLLELKPLTSDMKADR
jgi:hypothetical protein